MNGGKQKFFKLHYFVNLEEYPGLGGAAHGRSRRKELLAEMFEGELHGQDPQC